MRLSRKKHFASKLAPAGRGPDPRGELSPHLENSQRPRPNSVGLCVRAGYDVAGVVSEPL